MRSVVRTSAKSELIIFFVRNEVSDEVSLLLFICLFVHLFVYSFVNALYLVISSFFVLYSISMSIIMVPRFDMSGSRCIRKETSRGCVCTFVVAGYHVKNE